MKKLIITLFLFCFSINSLSQDLSKDEIQKDRYENSFTYLDGNNNIRAIRAFFFTYKTNRQSEIGQKSLSKIDSLKPIIRRELINNIQGEWKLKTLGSNLQMTELDDNSKIEYYLIIKEEEISFYEKSKNDKTRRLVKKETIVFYDKDGMFPLFNSFVFSDNQIWHYSIRGFKTLHTLILEKKLK